MFVKRIQVEEGFLDGLDLELTQGLNVLIGARGTGKTSLIELIRFCLDVKGYSAETIKRSKEHALSVLGAGQITVTLSDDVQEIVVTRTANDDAPRVTGQIKKPIIFSQTEIETVGLQPGGRLKLLDSFIQKRSRKDAAELEVESSVISLTTEAEALRREIDDFTRQISELSEIDKQISELAPAEQKLTKLSADSDKKKKALDSLSDQIASLSVATKTTERFGHGIKQWKELLTKTISSSPTADSLPVIKGGDPLKLAKEHVQKAREHLSQSLESLLVAEDETIKLVKAAGEKKILAEDQARQIRKEIEALQAGAGNVARQGQQLREKKAQLESLKSILTDRDKKLKKLLTLRNQALDKLDEVRESLFNERSKASKRLNQALGPKIRIEVNRAGQFEVFAASITDILRGSGLRYNDLAETLAKRLSPRELLEAADTNDFDFISEAAEITKDRAARVLAQLKQTDLGTLATVAVDDTVEFQLLDGLENKEGSRLAEMAVEG